MSALEGRAAPAEYLMIKSLEIEHFRCFKHLSLAGLRRINVVVGENAAGKTALLEAMLLGARATPQAALILTQLRTLPVPSVVVALPMPVGVAPGSFKSLWDHLFSSFDSSRPISIKYQDSKDQTFALRVFYSGPETTSLPLGTITLGPVGMSGVPTNVIPIVFERTPPNGQTHRLEASLNPQNQIVQAAAADLGPACAIFASTLAYNPQDNAIWFSQLSAKGREKELNEILHREFDYVADMSVLSPDGIPAVYTALKPHPVKFPVTLVSAGIHKFLSIILAASSYENGIVLIDEVENGIYYRRLPALWTVLHRLTEHNKSQVFVSTHSRECLNASLPILQADPDAFSLIQMERTEGQCSARVFSGHEYQKALEQGAEMR
jgi:hypothetical protein